MLPILRIGPLALQLPGLLMLFGVWWGMSLIEKEAPRLKLPASAVYNGAFFAIVFGLLGARLFYAARFFSIYLENPLNLFSLNTSTLSPTAGLLIGLLAALIYGQRKRLPLWPSLDALTPGLALLAIFLGLAHLSSGNAFGKPTTLPWAISLLGEARHPSQIYEIFAAGIIFLALVRLRTSAPFPGFVFLLFVGLTSAARLFLEAFRGDNVIWFGSVRAAQVVSLAVLLLVLWSLRARFAATFQSALPARTTGEEEPTGGPLGPL